MKKVLLATDFSEYAHHAIEYALSLLGEQSVHYFLVNAYYLRHNTPEMLISLEDILHEQSEEGLKQHFANIKHNHQSLNIETMSAHGAPAVTIKKVVKEHGVDLVVIGSRGRSALNETFFGSNTADLVRRITQPILIVPLHYSVEPPKKIVFATDLTQVDDLDVLQPMLSLARKYESEIIVVNVTGNNSDLKVKRALKRLDFNSRFSHINYRFEEIQNENTFDGISELINIESANMLVLSPKEYPGFKGMFHRSITKRMIQYAEIPILVIK